MKALFITAVLVLTGLSANATSASKECWSKAESTLQINVCAGLDYKAALIKLNKATVTLTATLQKAVENNSRGVNMLLESVTRTATNLDVQLTDQCTIDSEMIGGSAMTAEVIGCKTREMRKRTIKFNALNKEYDNIDE